MLPETLPAQPAFLRRRLLPGLTVAGLLLLAIMLLSLGLHLVNLDTLGDANTYYTAAVKSMLLSWKNFFFVAAEPGGSVSVDKPPLGLWIEAAFAYVLGVSGFSVSLPNILAGVFSLPLLYALVKRRLGELAGLVAALVMALTPVFVATNRNNTMDGLLVFCLLLAAWAFVQATETGRLRWVLLGAFIIGLGFNIKMMQAFLPAPAFYALYFFGSPEGWRRKLLNLGLASVLLTGVSLSWAVAVDLTPADQRPFVGSSGDNTVMGLIFGHNGLSRLESTGVSMPGGGQNELADAGAQAGNLPALGGGQGAPQQALDACANAAVGAACSFTQPNGNAITGSCMTPPNTSQLACAPQGMRPQNGSNQAGGPNGQAGPGGQGGAQFSNETGNPGALRFFTSPLSKQMSWLLPFALISVALGLFGARLKLPVRAGVHKALILWGGWLLTCVVFFSLVSGIFHAYYAIMLAPALGAMVGLGFAQLSTWSVDKKWVGLLLAAAALVTIGFQLFAAYQYGDSSWWLLGAAVLLGLGGLLLVFQQRLAYLTVLAAMLVIPFYWTVKTVTTNANNSLPTAYAGSVQPTGGPGGAPQSADTKGNTELVSYLQANTQDVEYLAAAPSSGQSGAQLVLATGRPVLYMGGFGGWDQVVSAEDLSALVAAGKLRYVLYGGGQGNQASISTWLQSACTVDPQSSALTAGSQGGPGPNNQAMTLYVCQ